MTSRRICLLLVVLVSVGLATAFLQEKRTIWGEIQDRHELKKLRHLLEHDEFKEARDALDGQGAGQGLNITLFAPDNHAMKHAKHHFKIDKRFVGLIKMLLKYHVIEGEVRSTDFDQTASDSKHRKKLFIETCADDEHAVNLPNQSGQVLQLVKEGEKLYITYGLSKKKYHVNIVTKDIECSNGVLHVIDKVLLLPRRATTMASFEYLFGFVEGLIKFDLARSVNEETGVTAIVPTDEAWLKFFMAHGKQAEKEDVKNIFKYHITDEDDVFYSDRFRDPKGKKALNTKFGKDKLVIRVNQDGDVMINEKPVQVEDIITSNGVMHVVNQVLIPPTLQHKFAEPADEDEMEW